MAGHAQLKFVMTECSKTQIRLTGFICKYKLAKRTEVNPQDIVFRNISLTSVYVVIFEYLAVR